jgi:glycosyltransferase involved in cell wall biosynthesis
LELIKMRRWAWKLGKHAGPADKREGEKPEITVCLHALRPVREDARALRTAIALAQSGFVVSIVDIEHDPSRGPDKNLRDVPNKYIAMPAEVQQERLAVRHIVMARRFTRYYTPTQYLPWLFFKCLRIIKGIFPLLRSSADLYHASDVTALPACCIAALVRGKPLICDPYELPLVQPQTTRFRVLHSIFVWLLRAMLARCSGLILTSPAFVPLFHKRYGGRTAVVVRNIPIYQPPVASDHLRQYLGLAPDVRIALYQGILHPERGLDVIIHAAKFLAPKIVIVMKAWGEERVKLEKLIACEQVSDRVKIIPAVPFEELHSWTASADLGLVIYRPYSISVQHSLPNKVFEYLMAGVPILASSLDAVEEIIRTYEVGHILTSLEPGVIGRAMSEMLADHIGLERMRSNALKASARELRWDIEQKRLIALYQEILARQDGVINIE